MRSIFQEKKHGGMGMESPMTTMRDLKVAEELEYQTNGSNFSINLDLPEDEYNDPDTTSSKRINSVSHIKNQLQDKNPKADKNSHTNTQVAEFLRNE